MVKFISGCVIFLVVYSSCSLSEVASNRTITKVLVYQNRALIAYEPFYENNLDCGQNEEAGLLNINFDNNSGRGMLAAAMMAMQNGLVADFAMNNCHNQYPNLYRIDIAAPN